jgi:hypothetical protein
MIRQLMINAYIGVRVRVLEQTVCTIVPQKNEPI